MVARSRLPNRRDCETHDLFCGKLRLTATVGFDAAGQPAEIFLSGAKDGSEMAAVLDDASVVISLALQHGIPAAALHKSVARLPESFDTPATLAASPIGAALDLLASYQCP